MATLTTKQIKGNLNRGFGGTIPLKGVLPWLGANFFDGLYGAADLLGNNVTGPLAETLTGIPQGVYNYQGEYQDRLKASELPIYGDGGAAQMLAQPPASRSARTVGSIPPVVSAPSNRQPSRGAAATLKSLSALTPVGGVYSNAGNPPSWGLLAASGQPNIPAALAQPPAATQAPTYAYQQQPIRNAFTMSAPADDARARIKAEEARIRFNAAEQSFKSLKTPEAEAAYKEAQADADRWSKWAAMSPVARKQVLMNGERAANAAQGRDKFATLRNEMDTPGAAELLAYAAAVNSGGPAVVRQPDGSATVSGRYGSGYTTGATAPRGTRTALSDVTDDLRRRQKVRAAFENGQAASLLL